jgi:phosphohistidine phosphatase
MRLYLVQHGKAVDKKVDPDRPLTDEGAEEVDAVATFLSGRELGICEVWHSGKTRARQTAERVAARLAPTARIVARDDLAPDDDPKPVAARLHKSAKDLLIVGHLPFLSKLASLLLTDKADAAVIAFRNAGVVCLERDEEGAWQAAWIITPDFCGS